MERVQLVHCNPSTPVTVVQSSEVQFTVIQLLQSTVVQSTQVQSVQSTKVWLLSSSQSGLL